MLKRVSIWFVIALTIPQSFVFGQISQPAIYKDAAAYEVYSVLLSMPDNEQETKNKIFVIRQETADSFAGLGENDANHLCLRPDAESEKVIGTAIVDFIEANKTKWVLQTNMELKTRYKLVNADEISQLFKTDGWTDFYRRYPNSGGLITLSAVGFNADKTIAIVSEGRSCGGLCGQGEYYVLQKKDGKWIPLTWQGLRCSWAS